MVKENTTPESSESAESASTEVQTAKVNFMYPGDAEHPAITVQAENREEADKLYKAKLKEETK